MKIEQLYSEEKQFWNIDGYRFMFYQNEECFGWIGVIDGQFYSGEWCDNDKYKRTDMLFIAKGSIKEVIKHLNNESESSLETST